MVKQRISRAEIVFFMAYGIYLLVKEIGITSIGVDNAVISPVLKCIRYMTYILVVIKLVIDDRYKEGEVWRIILIMGVMLAASMQKGDNSLVCNFLFLIAARNIFWKKILAFSAVVQGGFTFLIVIGSQFGVIEDWTYDIGGRFRHSLGFEYPSHIATIAFFVTLSYLILREEKIAVVEIVLIALLGIMLYMYTDARAGMIITFLSCIVFYAMKYIRWPLKHNFIAHLIYIGGIWTIALVSIFGIYFYSDSNRIYVKLDSIFNNRIHLGSEALHQYGFPLFGRRIEWVGNGGYGYTFKEFKGDYNFVDCSFIKLMLDYGVFVLIIVLIGYSLAAGYALRKGNRYLAMAVLFTMVYSVIEPRIVEVGYNPMIIVAAALFSEKVTVINENNRRWKIRQQAIFTDGRIYRK